MQRQSTTALDLIDVARQALSYRPTQLTQLALRDLALARRRQRPTGPTLMDVEQPTTKAAVEALRLATVRMTQCLERAAVQDVTATEAFTAARAVLATYFTTYVRMQAQERQAWRTR